MHREILNVRKNVGLLDASTLGKIIVKGPDAGRFLDMLYTGVMSNLPVGKCRYGLMCNEQGFLSDDGVVARIDEDTLLCHTTTGGADRIHAHMEDWLQCEWWDWQVYTANVTEQYAQVAVVGPKARKLLEKLGGMDVSKEALPFMQWADGTLGGLPGPGLPDQLLGRTQLRDRRAGQPRPRLLGGLSRGGRGPWRDALRHRGAACACGPRRASS